MKVTRVDEKNNKIFFVVGDQSWTLSEKFGEIRLTLNSLDEKVAVFPCVSNVIEVRAIK